MASRFAAARQRLLPSFDARRLHAAEARPVYAMVLAMALFVVLGAGATSFTIDAAALRPPLVVVLGLLALGACVRAMGSARLGDGLEGAGLYAGAALATPLCAALLAATNLPLADPWLAAADRALFGFDRAPLVAWWDTQPGLMAATRAVYATLAVQPLVLLALLLARDEARRAWQFLTAWVLTLLVTTAIFPFVPATGGPPFFLDFVEPLMALRDGSQRVLGTEVLTGIIAFPSFHAAGAVLLAWGFARMRVIGPVAIALNAAMFGSALIACHYLVDLIAGALVAAGAIVAAGRIQARLTA